MSEAKKYHRALHEEIFSCRKLAEWIYHDFRLNCDNQAAFRTTERLMHIREQYNDRTLYGIVASWVVSAVNRIDRVMRQMGKPMPELKTVLPDYASADNDPADLEVEQRAVISATQFFVLVGNDELETAEAIFNAATSSSDEDMWAIIQAVLNISITLSGQALAEL